MNSGAYLASGEYICFLDDDDIWSDCEHLRRAYDTLTQAAPRADVLYCNQTAFNSDGEQIESKLWIADLEARLDKSMKVSEGAFRVSAEFLLSSSGFAHLNCTIIRRSLYLDIKGMDENIRYECDRDIYLRTLDAAQIIFYSPIHIARHNVPDQKKKDNMSTLLNDMEKRLYQINVLEKAVLLAQRKSIRAYATNALADIYRHLSVNLMATGRTRAASKHARQALALRYTLKWHAYTWYLCARGIFSS